MSQCTDDDLVRVFADGNNKSPVEVFKNLLEYIQKSPYSKNARMAAYTVSDVIKSDTELLQKYDFISKAIDLIIEINDKPLWPNSVDLDSRTVLKDIQYYTQDEILTAIGEDPEIYSNNTVKVILGYYVSKYICALHKCKHSSYILGMMFGVPKIIIDNIVDSESPNACNTVIEHYEKYETLQFNLEQMLIDAACALDFEHADNSRLRDYIIGALGYDKIVSLVDKSNILPQAQRDYHRFIRGES
jgi:hypothetical protein